MIDAATHLGFTLALASSQPVEAQTSDPSAVRVEPDGEARAEPEPVEDDTTAVRSDEPAPDSNTERVATTASVHSEESVGGSNEKPLATSTSAAPPTPEVTEVTDPDADDPTTVIRPHAGHWGMHFSFGGLAPMSIGGLNDVNAGRLMFSELGVRRAFDNGWALPFSAGVGWVRHNPDEGDTENDAGLSVSIGIRKSFRVWRRIAPYTGGDVRVTYVDPEGEDNRLIGLAFGPNLGIEYFVANRVSLLLQGDLTLALAFADSSVTTDVATRISGGGQMGLVFYF